MSKFSDFIRNASPEEKERVYTEVMHKATERQKKDAEFWRTLYVRQCFETERLKDALKTIADNTPCDQCQEAALVARKALGL